MIGIAFGYPSDAEQRIYQLPSDELRFARIEDEFYWRIWEPKGAEELAEKILNEVGHRPREISGFTLFWNGDQRDGRKPGWQMSVRRKGEEGWDVQRITDAQAQSVFNVLRNSGHPDGPWTLPEKTDFNESTCRHGLTANVECPDCAAMHTAALSLDENGDEIHPVDDLETEIFYLAESFGRLAKAIEKCISGL